MKVLVTGGAGFIGSTICSCLLDNGHTPIILDSLVNGRKEFVAGRIFYQGDIADEKLLEKIVDDHRDIDSVIHCAALIVVPDSVENPNLYYKENVSKSLTFFNKINELGIKKVVFSSSASVYDSVEGFMVTEESAKKPLSPYARTKYMMEMILEDLCNASDLQGIALRYFNPIGADPKMRTGLQIKEPTHIWGLLVQAALGKIEKVSVTGTDYETRDGSGVRDYIHVWDLARAHCLALENFEKVIESKDRPGSENYSVINLGTGNGVTVFELIKAVENVFGKSLNYESAPRRQGDSAGAFANCSTAKNLIGWEVDLSIEEGIADALKWGEMREKILF